MWKRLGQTHGRLTVLRTPAPSIRQKPSICRRSALGPPVLAIRVVVTVERQMNSIQNHPDKVHTCVANMAWRPLHQLSRRPPLLRTQDGAFHHCTTKQSVGDM